MQAPAFWWRRRPSLAAQLLRPSAALYGALAARRMRLPGERAAVPVICIGNFTVGGAGKTPAALAVAALLKARGERPFFLSRGYGGSLSGPVLVDPRSHAAAEVGDEPLLLARAAPTVVSRDRPAGARLAAEQGASVIVMDDGLQNPSLHKDRAIAVVDGATGFGNGLPLPSGPLRAPLAAQWQRVDAVLVIGAGAAGDEIARDARRRGKAVFRGRLAPDPPVAASLRGVRVLAFAGIGRPQKFFETLRAVGAQVAIERAFPDHHPYSPADVAALSALAQAQYLVLVTTEKDRVRLVGMPGMEAAVALPVSLLLDDKPALRRLLLPALRPASSPRAG
jgi:tetraacyldisaccharide 4'-kinase